MSKVLETFSYRDGAGVGHGDAGALDGAAVMGSDDAAGLGFAVVFFFFGVGVGEAVAGAGRRVGAAAWSSAYTGFGDKR